MQNTSQAASDIELASKWMPFLSSAHHPRLPVGIQLSHESQISHTYIYKTVVRVDSLCLREVAIVKCIVFLMETNIF